MRKRLLVFMCLVGISTLGGVGAQSESWLQYTKVSVESDTGLVSSTKRTDAVEKLATAKTNSEG